MDQMIESGMALAALQKRVSHLRMQLLEKLKKKLISV